MTKEITKAFILQQIQDKFKLRELEPETFSFQERVVPVYDVSEHLKKWEIVQETISVSSTGGKSVLVVPGNERWHVSGYGVVFMTAGAYKVAGVYIIRWRTPGLFVYLDLTKNQTESYAVRLPKAVTLDSGDALNINIDDYTSTANVRVNVDIVKEEIR